jgi:DNA-binding beta-propeller fold protein YncE
MTLKEVGRIPLPPHPTDGGFDHAAVSVATSRLYVAHTANHTVDVVDLRSRKFVRSLRDLNGVAGVRVSEERRLLFTSNRGEDTVSGFGLPEEKELFRWPTGRRPNGMAFDPGRGTLLVAGVGQPETGAPPTATLFDTAQGRRKGQLVMPGRMRWATYHAATDAFYVNIADPPCIAQIDGSDVSRVTRLIDVPAQGPHGLEQDPDGRTLYCACDDGKLVVVDLPSGTARVAGSLAGAPDVLWVNPRLGHLYVAIGEPGVVQVFRTDPIAPLETVSTAEGAHTLTVDPTVDEVFVFLPQTHEALALLDLP